MSLSLTAAAADHITRMLDKRGRGLGLRIGVKKSGCSGFGYAIDYADSIEEGDEVFESHGIRLVVNKQNLRYLEGTEIDFVKTNALNQGFEFRNPSARNTCGCGESFGV